MLNNVLVLIKKVHTIAYYTAKEIIKSKILINVMLLGLALMLLTYVAFSFTYGEPSRVALDFGLGILSLSSVAIAIFIGVSLLSKEIENRTVYMIVSRPVPRFCFILGKIIGLASVLAINVLMLSFLTLLCYFVVGGEYQPIIGWSIFFTLLEAVIVLLVVCALSLVTTPTLSTLFSIMIYISGHAVSETKLTTFAKVAPGLMEALDFYHFILPGYYKLNIKEFVIYNQNLDFSYIFGTAAYGVLYSLFLIILSIAIFEKKNLD